MLVNLLGELVLIGLSVMFAWLAWRAFKSRRAWAKWGGAALGGASFLLFGSLSVIIGNGLHKLYGPMSVPIPALEVAGTPEQIARGEHLARATCAGCHSPDGDVPLIGGRDIGEDSPAPIGRIVSRNLTPGGELADWSDGEIMRTLRDGVHKSGRPVLMPSVVYSRNLSDEDIEAIIAYLRSQPVVRNELPSTSPSLVLALAFGSGRVQTPRDLEPIKGAVIAPPKAASVEYGAYLISFQGCDFCHDADLQGRTTPGLFPVSPPVLPFIRAWSQDEFIRTMRTGVAPGGYVIKPTMPTKQIGMFDDIELAAMYRYLRSLT